MKLGAALRVFWVTCDTMVLATAVSPDPPSLTGEEGDACTGAI